jgi:mannose-6-phosphate isomerase-like protein (cupin superfamily)
MIKKPSENEIDVRENMRGGQGKVTIRHFFKKDEFTSRTRLCATLSIPPEAGIGMHQHENEDEVYLVTKGAGMLDDGQTRTPVAQGDAILTGNGASHAITNNGNDTLELVAVIMCY